MGSCNPSDHPIFWCAELKRLERKRIADESLRDWKNRKLIERRSRAKEQAHIVTGLTDDPLISFNDANRYHVDNELRYKTSPAQQQHYRAELDRIVAEKENRARRLRCSDREPAKPHAGGGTGAAGGGGGPWGRPGPGGKPWRPPKNVGHNFMKSLGWTNQETLQDLDLELVSRMQRQLEEENRFLKGFSNCCSRCVCQCVSQSLEPRSSGARPGSARRLATGAPDALRNYPSPPATAPGPPAPPLPPPPPSLPGGTVVRVPRLCHYQQHQQSPSGAPPPLPGTRAGPGSKGSGGATTGATGGRRNGAGRGGGAVAPTRNCMITGGVELVPLLAKRRSQPRPISLGTTDVTKIDKYTANGSLARRHDDGYLTDLCAQMHQKQRRVDTWRAREFESSRQHFETWSSFWGRPGHGAPLPNKNKLNLDSLLYKPRPR
ncbi:translation initiation factor IF-2 [Anopheles bellator]|uniref:translation initiation factor IF-2 n=1 Tax=Anopheles bellator TaxID=139047 RepID=UPI00264984EF|nr:translation initiation factor IF-2 [Anopheles bellator]